MRSKKWVPCYWLKKKEEGFAKAVPVQRTMTHSQAPA
jgi:hypothetical protein